MDYLLFLLVCLAATLSPGPAVLLTIKNSASYGVLKSLSGIAGNVAAMMTLASMSAAGLSAILLASDLLFSVIKYAGGIYLIYLGIVAWNSKADIRLADSQSAKSRRSLFAEAYFVGVSNPKAIAFYTALFPQFVNTGSPVATQLAILGLTFAGFSFAALLMCSLLTSRVQECLSAERVRSIFHKATGGVFMGFGLSLMMSEKA